MLRKLFLSIIILSTFASEGGAYLSEELVNYYLINFTYLDVMQDSINVAPNYDAKNLSGVEKKGTPAAFYKYISQSTIDSKSSNANHLEALLPSFVTAGLFIFIVLFVYLNKKLFIIARQYYICHADSSPPLAFC